MKTEKGNRLTARLGLLLVAVAVALLVSATPAGAVKVAKDVVGKKATPFVLDNSWGHKDTMKDYLGKKVIIMNFGSAQSEGEAVALFIAMARRYYKDKRVKLYSMIVLKDLPFYADRQTVINRIKEIGRNISYPELGGTMDWEGKVSAKYGVDMGPNLVVVDKKGKIVYKQGKLEKGSMRKFVAAVEKALKE